MSTPLIVYPGTGTTDALDQYKRWRDAHPAAFILNCRKAGWVLRRADCPIWATSRPTTQTCSTRPGSSAIGTRT